MISARNQFTGKIERIEMKGILARIKVRIEKSVTFTVVIAREAVRELGVGPGSKAEVIIKATEVIISKER